jgi:hypothetical protein
MMNGGWWRDFKLVLFGAGRVRMERLRGCAQLMMSQDWCVCVCG